MVDSGYLWCRVSIKRWIPLVDTFGAESALKGGYHWWIPFGAESALIAVGTDMTYFSRSPLLSTYMAIP